MLKFDIELVDMKSEKIIVPAIIAKTQEELVEKIYKVKDFVDRVQLDVMDGKFVPNNSLDFDFKLPKTNCHFEAHLMIQNPLKWIEKNYMKIDTVLAHIETCDNPKEVIDFVKEKEKLIGFVLNPETPLDRISDFINDIDQVLIMTVNPGFYGSRFLPEMVDKISELRNFSPDLDIEVDGGVTPSTISLVDNAGANLFVSGSYIVKADNVKQAISNLKEILSD